MFLAVQANFAYSKSCSSLRCSIVPYLLTPWSRVLLEKLTGSATSQEFPRIFGTRKFITVLKSARHLSLSWANSIQSAQPPPTSWRSILILFSHNLKVSHPRCVVKIQVREENPTLYSHKTQLNIKLSLLQHYNMFRPKLSAIFRLYMKPI